MANVESQRGNIKFVSGYLSVFDRISAERCGAVSAKIEEQLNAVANNMSRDYVSKQCVSVKHVSVSALLKIICYTCWIGEIRIETSFY